MNELDGWIESGWVNEPWTQRFFRPRGSEEGMGKVICHLSAQCSHDLRLRGRANNQSTCTQYTVLSTNTRSVPRREARTLCLAHWLRTDYGYMLEDAYECSFSQVLPSWEFFDLGGGTLTEQRGARWC
ncbi:hypothetical protein CLAIMM_02615 [Cladophialophora immunda]|nr:hypothetical protein CLAIMM_02615 [Cladophialophora immunda]